MTLVFHRSKKTRLNIIHETMEIIGKLLRDVGRCLQDMNVVSNTLLQAISQVSSQYWSWVISIPPTYLSNAPNTMWSISEWVRESVFVEFTNVGIFEMTGTTVWKEHKVRICLGSEKIPNSPVWWITTTDLRPRKASKSMTSCKKIRNNSSGRIAYNEDLILDVRF
jgi:hypothetical protein